MVDAKERRVVAIAGHAPSSREGVNAEPDSVEIWGLNEGWTFMRRWDKWFEIHNHEVTPGRWAEIAKLDCPVYMREVNAEIPKSVKFPMEAVTEKWGLYLSSTIDYMLALAIYEGVDEVHLHGVDMSAHSEYAYQRPSCEYWLGIAKGLGMTVVLPNASPLLRAPLYGVENKHFILRENVRDALSVMQGQLAAKQREYDTIHGSVQTLRKLLGEEEG